MGLLSAHEEIVWREFQAGKSTSEIAKNSRNPEWLYSVGLITEQEKIDLARAIHSLEKRIQTAEKQNEKKRYQQQLEKQLHKWVWSPAYVSRVLNRARKKIEQELRNHATSHRLDIESVLDYKGLLIGFDYQANAEVYIVFTIELGVVLWYKHDSYAGKPCPECPKEKECRKTLDVIMQEYGLSLRENELKLPMTKQSITVFHKLTAKEIPRYKRREET